MTAQRALGAIAAFVALGVADLVFGPGLFEQTNLLFRTQQSPPTWVPWNNNYCWKDDASQWRGWKISDDGYRVDWGDESC